MSVGGSCAAPEEAWVDEVVKEAEGVKLHLYRRGSTGYLGVRLDKGRYRAALSSGGKRIHIGNYGTAVEAAVAYAKYVATAGREESSKEKVSEREDEVEVMEEVEEEEEDESEEESDEEEKEAGQCGTPGCTLADFHAGPCSSWSLLSARKRGWAEDKRFVCTR